jgi:hypothetical protein
MDLNTQIDAIPSELGVAGAYLAKGGGAGKPDLPTLLGQIRAAFIALASTDAAKGMSLFGVCDAAGRITAVNGETALAEIAARLLNPAASEAAIKAIPAAARIDGSMIVELGTSKLWVFDADSAAGGSAWVLVPDVGTGRWLRSDLSAADLAAVTGALLIGSNAAGYIAATVAGQLAEVKAIADAGMAVVKRTCTINYAPAGDNFAALAGGVKTFSKNIGAQLPANARLVGWSIGESVMTLFDDATHGDFGLELGIGGDANSIMASESIKAGTTGLPTKGTAGVDGFAMRSITAQQMIAKLTSSVDLNTVTAGEISVNLFYIVLA